jgi:hypothetical protein
MVETEALLAEEPTVTIAGREYVLQPLGFKAMAPLARILEVAQKHSGVTIMEIVSLAQDADKVVNLFLAAMGWAEAEMFLLLSMLLGVTQDELRDPHRFPLSGIGALLAPLAQQVDLAGFLSGHTEVTSSLPPEMLAEEPSADSSGKSNAEPDGPTTS